MKLSQFLKLMFLLTILSLVYIHLQMQIFDLAYQGKRREKKIRILSDENGHLTYKILTLQSANNLGIKLLSDNSEMQFMDSENIVTLEAKENLKESSGSNSVPRSDKKPNILLSLFSLKPQELTKP